MAGRGMKPRLSEAELLDLVQRQTLSYFLDFAHPPSRMARERSNAVARSGFLDTVTTGGTGFGIMAMLAGAERGFLRRIEVLQRMATIVEFLANQQAGHGVFPHFMHGAAGAPISFSPRDDGGDLVETSFLMMG